MPILNTMFEKPHTDDLVKSLGNMIVSGVWDEGSRKLYFNILSTLLAGKKTVILVDGGLSETQHASLHRMIEPHMVGRRLYDFGCFDGASRVDALSAFDSTEEKAEFFEKVLSMSSGMPEMLRNRAERFYRCAMLALDSLGRTYTLDELCGMDVDAVVELVHTAPLPEREKEKSIRFLTDAGMYSAYTDIETCLTKPENSKLFRMFSGDTKVSDILRDGNVILFSAFLSEDFKKNELLLNTLFYMLGKRLEKVCAGSRVNFLIKSADYISGDYIKRTLAYNASYHHAACLFVEDITRYIAKNGNDVLDRVKSAVVFNQGSDENAKFWSAFFGSRDMNEKSFSYTKKKSLNPFASSWDSGGVVSAPRKYNSTTVNIQKVNKPIYRPEVFQELRLNEAMCYLRQPLMRRKTRIEE